MGKQLTLTVLTPCSFLLIVASLIGATLESSPKEVEVWFQKQSSSSTLKLTKIRFYFHDQVGTANATAVTVAQANNSASSSTYFGMVNIMDDPLTVGPDLSSKLVGRAQGLYATASLEEVALFNAINFIFTEGEYNGSTLSVLGYNPHFHLYREMPIVGGSGFFRLARGVAIFKNYYANRLKAKFTVEVSVLAQHY
ncbi:hypothetical protein LguiB_022385 [Lonicera macranthoides]